VYWAADDFGSVFPSWIQLSAVAVLVGGMAIALRVLYKSQATSLADMKQVHAEQLADLRAQRDRAVKDLDELNREMRTSVMPVLAQTTRSLERLLDVRSHDRG
jgi:hypothetical protein